MKTRFPFLALVWAVTSQLCPAHNRLPARGRWRRYLRGVASRPFK